MNGQRVFNTGKIQIGLAYQPKPYVESDKDMLKLQRALMGTGRRIDIDGLAIAASCLVAVGVFLVPFWSR